MNPPRVLTTLILSTLVLGPLLDSARAAGTDAPAGKPGRPAVRGPVPPESGTGRSRPADRPRPPGLPPTDRRKRRLLPPPSERRRGDSRPVQEGRMAVRHSLLRPVGRAPHSGEEAHRSDRA